MVSLQVAGTGQQEFLTVRVILRIDLARRTERDQTSRLVQNAGFVRRLLELNRLLLRKQLLVAGMTVHGGASRDAVEIVDHHRNRFILDSLILDAIRLFLRFVQYTLIFLRFRIFGFRCARRRWRLQRQIQRARGRRSGQVPRLKDVIFGKPRIRGTLHRNVPGIGCTVWVLMDLVTVIAQVV